MQHDPTPVPSSRIIGVATERRRQSLALVDVLVHHTWAKHRDELAGWRLEAVLVTSTSRLHGADVIALRAAPEAGIPLADLIPVDPALLADLAERIVKTIDDVVRVIPDVSTAAPAVCEHAAPALISQPWWWADEPRSA